MFRIRLQACKTPAPSKKGYDIVSIDSRRKISSHKCNKIGHYRIYPSGKKTVWIDQGQLLRALFEGAQPTKSVGKLIEPIIKGI
jgi:ribosomal protein S16